MNLDIKISTNFKLKHYVVSKEFPDIAAKTVLDEYSISNIVRLNCSIGQPVRNKYGVTLVNSGVRTPGLKACLVKAGYKPSATSQHDYAEAGDYDLEDKALLPAYNYINNNLDFCQIIIYGEPVGNGQFKFKFIHGSVDALELRDRKAAPTHSAMFNWDNVYHQMPVNAPLTVKMFEDITKKKYLFGGAL